MAEIRELAGNITAETSGMEGTTEIVRISNPAKRNALEPDSYWAIGDAVRAASTRPEIRCVIITGDESAFCSGMDLAAFIAGGSEEAAAHSLAGIEHVINAITRADVPVIAAAEGAVAGIGASLASACDVIVASDNSFITLPFGRIGLMPDGGAVATLAASVGRHRAMQIALRQERIPAADAQHMGLVAEVVAAGAALETALQWAEEFRGSPRGAITETKRGINRVTLGQLALSLAEETRAQTALTQTEEHKEGVRAFMERRAPTF